MYAYISRCIGGGSLPSTTDVWQANLAFETFTHSFDLQYAASHHCAVALDNNTIMVIDNTEVYTVDVNTNEFTNLPPLSVERSRHSCGLAHTDIGLEVVVVGGTSNPRSVEIFNLYTKSWRAGPSYPVNTVDSALVQYGRSFVVIGGGTTLLYEYDFVNEDWILMPEFLSNGGSGMKIGVLIDGSLLNCS